MAKFAHEHQPAVAGGAMKQQRFSLDSGLLAAGDPSPADLARQMKAHPDHLREALKGKTLAMIFEKPSLRTRVSFDVGIEQLGGFSVYLSPAEINLGKRESVYDVAKNLERMVQGIMIRTFAHEIVEQMAEYANIPSSTA